MNINQLCSNIICVGCDYNINEYCDLFDHETYKTIQCGEYKNDSTTRSNQETERD